MHTRRRTIALGLLAFFALLLVSLVRLPAQDGPAARPVARKLLYPADASKVPETLRPIVRRLLAAEQAPVEPSEATPAGVFVRVVTRKYILDGEKLREGGTLGVRPFVFVGLPEILYGRSLLQVFSAIGYSADDVLGGELGAAKVAVVFRWEDRVVVHPGRDGTLPEAWQSAVYATTWDNVFALVERMATDKDWHVVQAESKPPAPTRLQLRSPREVLFVRGYPDAGRKRIKSSSYYTLREGGGADWEYRSILERSLGLAEHFTGDGTSQPTLIGSGKQRQGFPEFVGPNRELTALPEIAVIDLGTLRVSE